MTERPDRPLFRHDGSPAAEEHLASLSHGHDSGRVLLTHRAWPSWGFLAWFIVPALVVAAFVLVLSADRFLAVVPVGLALGLASVFVAGGYLDRLRVCEHALVLGPRGTQIIPFETIDPGRVYDTRGLFLSRQIDLKGT